MLIVAGEYSLSTFEGTEQVFRPARMVVHPDYSATSKNADIMLIKVTDASVLGAGKQGTQSPSWGQRGGARWRFGIVPVGSREREQRMPLSTESECCCIDHGTICGVWQQPIR